MHDIIYHYHIRTNRAEFGTLDMTMFQYLREAVIDVELIAVIHPAHKEPLHLI